MSRPTIEDAFDDDTELALPARPLPNTGPKGALLASVDSDDDSDDDGGGGASDASDDAAPPLPNPGPARLPQMQAQAGAGVPGASPQPAAPTVSDLTPYKKWTCIYPIYIDAKRAYGAGARRVARAEGVWWPLSRDIADASARLGLGTLHEVQKRHPRDWANPGRVRVQLRRDGRPVNERIKTKKQLLEAIAFYIQTIKPELTPKPPFDTPSSSGAPDASASTPGKPQPASKAKQGAPKSTTKGKGKAPDRASAKDKDNARTAARARLPQPPEPQPPLARRVSAYSPALPSGVLVDTVKAGLSAAAAEAAAGGAPPGAGGKGKRKVVRVRG
ncbi:signal recognition particle, SRP19 subunit [Phellopilus nigrolimitatus]|nr:signal recognition particle, SRP19 subunit [Phellopilus nigrolimitatus]